MTSTNGNRPSSAPVIWWIRQDLRLADNEALVAAMAHSVEVIPLFIVDPGLLSSAYVGSKRLAFLWAGLRQLDADLRQRGSYLTVRQGHPRQLLPQLLAEFGAEEVFAIEGYSPYAHRRDTWLEKRVSLHLLPGTLVHHPMMVRKPNGGAYTVFTPFSRTWRERPFPSATDLLPAPAAIYTPPGLTTQPIPTQSLPASVPFIPGETEARRRLDAFVHDGLADYAQKRNMVGQSGTSTLSPYLRFGMISAREAVVAALQMRDMAKSESARQSADTWLNELIWREFYSTILYHFPHVRQGSFRPAYEHIQWRNNIDEFEAWRAGRTGYPLVDAAMRQLEATGWMHNRARMVVASFLVKDLLINWQWGEKWFMQQLVDGDPAANNGGWQWSAGTGTDAAPYFRIFNPVTQSKKFDPDGAYIRQWVPELRYVSDRYIHEPWRMPSAAQQRSGCTIGRDYPEPVVDHKIARERTLATYKQARARMQVA